MKKIVALTIAGAAAAIVAGWRRVQRDNAIDGEGEPAPTASQSSAEASESSTSSDRPDLEGATKSELYERAQELGIEGRSKMTKAELIRAIRDAG